MNIYFNSKFIKKKLFLLIILFIPFYEIYIHGIILSDIILFVLISIYIAETFLRGRIEFNIWPYFGVMVMILFLYIVIIGLGGFNLQSESFYLAYLQHAYAPFYAIVVMAIGYNIYRENVIAKLIKYIAYMSLAIVLINLILMNVNFINEITKIRVFTSSGKLCFPFNRSSQLAGFLACSYPFVVAVFSWRKSDKDPSWVPFFVISLVFAIVSLRTGSRTGFAVIAIEATAFLLGSLWLSQWKGKFCGFVLLFFFLGLGYFLISYVVEQEGRAKRAFNAFSYAMKGKSVFVPVSERDIWETARSLIQEHPFIGGGLSATKTFYSQSVHNIYYGMMAEAGVGGVIFVLIIFIWWPVIFSVKTLSCLRNKWLTKQYYPIMVALWGQLIFGIYHYTLRQRWVWLLVILSIECYRELSHCGGVNKLYYGKSERVYKEVLRS